MKAKGWVEVVGDEDGRAQPFRLTAKGRKLLERAKPGWDMAQKKVKKLLGNEASRDYCRCRRWDTFRKFYGIKFFGFIFVYTNKCN